jgi:serine/threonine protein kinase
MKDSQIKDFVYRKLLRREQLDGKVKEGKTAKEQLALLIGWLSGITEDSGDDDVFTIVLESFERSETLDEQCLAKLNPPPAPRSFFTTMVANIGDYNYDKCNLVGRSGFGDVFKGTRVDSTIEYALKKQKCEGEHHSFIVPWLREVCAMLYATHPAILRVAGWNVYPTEEGCPEFWIITHLMPHTLSQKECAHYSATQKWIIVYGIARGMAYLHAQKILHRDLKP